MCYDWKLQSASNWTLKVRLLCQPVLITTADTFLTCCSVMGFILQIKKYFICFFKDSKFTRVEPLLCFPTSWLDWKTSQSTCYLQLNEANVGRMHSGKCRIYNNLRWKQQVWGKFVALGFIIVFSVLAYSTVYIFNVFLNLTVTLFATIIVYFIFIRDYMSTVS